MDHRYHRRGYTTGTELRPEDLFKRADPAMYGVKRVRTDPALPV